MLRRCIWELSSRRATSRIHRPIAPQISVYLSSRSQFSSAPPQNSLQGSATADNASHSRSYISKLVLGSVVIGAAITAAYKTGYIDIQVKDDKSSPNSSKLNAAKDSKDLELSVEQAVLLSNEETSTLEPDIEIVEKSDEPQGQEFEIKGEAILERVPLEETAPLKENEPTEVDSKIPSEVSSSVADEQKADSEVSSEGTTFDDILVSTEVTVEQNKSNETSKENIGEESQVSEEAVLKEAPIKVAMQDSADTEEGPYKSLSESYSLQDEGSQKISREEVNTDAVATFSTIKEGYIGATEQVRDEESSKDGKIVLDLIEAIHAAEKKQAESDAFVFAEEKRVLKEKYEKQLKDAKARALMYAEEAAILEKELNREKAKAAAAIKSLQEKSENKLREELQRKDEETDTQLKKVKELSKAELAAAIAKEKSSQIEKIAEADLNINALCMAFYARSEEARQTHSVHKLALGTLALEDALSRGLPIRAEVDALLKSLEGIDKDSLVELALSCLPEEILNNGTSTQMQLNQKFESLKGTLRHFSLIPAGGGGILAHMVAHVASSIKMKEQSGDGIEPVISKVENLLVDGNFVEAAEVLEGGVRGSEAEEVVIEWVRQARNRAVAEQALTLLQSYAMSITFT
ncbi:MICOS complex subunit MIC60, mitochondrial-like isoform X1 [Musa acuminata AAA Group]|uniref:MICOS complex subunit MIC60, mitochondrial-like isoform X1 n=1 Tax=Musa acuminata AAA Group TaxID=214697 RepID=UPI0031E1D8F4